MFVSFFKGNFKTWWSVADARRTAEKNGGWPTKSEWRRVGLTLSFSYLFCLKKNTNKLEPSKLLQWRLEKSECVSMENREHEFNEVGELVLTFSSKPPPTNSHLFHWSRFWALSLHWSSCRHLFFCMHFNGGVIWREKEVHAVASVEWESSKTASMEKVGIRRWWPGREGENELSHSIELVLSILHWSAFWVFSPPLKQLRGFWFYFYFLSNKISRRRRE